MTYFQVNTQRIVLDGLSASCSSLLAVIFSHQGEIWLRVKSGSFKGTRKESPLKQTFFYPGITSAWPPKIEVQEDPAWGWIGVRLKHILSCAVWSRGIRLHSDHSTRSHPLLKETKQNLKQFCNLRWLYLTCEISTFDVTELNLWNSSPLQNGNSKWNQVGV